MYMNGIQVPEIWKCQLFDSGASKCIQTTTTAISLPILGSHPLMDPQKNLWGCEVWPPHCSRLPRASARQTQTPVIIAIAIALGVHFGIRRNNDNKPSTNGPVQQDPDNPSIFTKDPSLKNAFYGIDYNPR